MARRNVLPFLVFGWRWAARGALGLTPRGGRRQESRKGCWAQTLPAWHFLSVIFQCTSARHAIRLLPGLGEPFTHGIPSPTPNHLGMSSGGFPTLALHSPGSGVWIGMWAHDPTWASHTPCLGFSKLDLRPGNPFLLEWHGWEGVNPGIVWSHLSSPRRNSICGGESDAAAQGEEEMWGESLFVSSPESLWATLSPFLVPCVSALPNWPQLL